MAKILVWPTLLLLLSRFSRVWFYVTPETAAHQAPPSLRFSRQEHWSGLPFPSPMHESEKWKWSHSSCPTLSEPMDCSLPGSPVHGVFQARVLEWGAIAFSNIETSYRQRKYWSVDNSYFWGIAWEERTFFHSFCTYFWIIWNFHEYYYSWIMELQRIKTKTKMVFRVHSASILKVCPFAF